MIDISLHHAARIMKPFDEEMAEHYGYLDELNALDLSKEDQAIYAIRKWLLDDLNPHFVPTEAGKFQEREACRYCLTKGLPWAGYWLPGIDGDANFQQYSMAFFKQASQVFYRLAWSELFPDHPFVPADLSQYRQRVDKNFVFFPHSPERWGEPEYKPW